MFSDSAHSLKKSSRENLPENGGEIKYLADTGIRLAACNDVAGNNALFHDFLPAMMQAAGVAVLPG
ncbi:hypothetical protein [Akkermansia muciniphila]|uniref:hypothetical protein n=1 Tax=Akkermansia muciniphila TaxID=239935 RepID=UPI0027D216B8|nr:hypothetical protein [Akkermansia muciniphila]WMB14747.1 hypothetical protein O4G22_08655 [Akkermansia muciniphila]WMB19231.1 hypothetical protein O4G19_08910 [Akkermansia muciniphila]